MLNRETVTREITEVLSTTFRTMTLKFRRGMAAEWTAINPILLTGEPGYEIDTGRHKIGNGADHWNELEYFITEQEIQDLIAAASIDPNFTVTTTDTGEVFKLIAFSNTTVKAIPFAASVPQPPSNLSRTISLSSVQLSWTASPSAGAKYDVYRDNVKIGTTTNLTFKDSSIAAGSTYQYKIIATDTYGQTSTATAPVTAFIDPALNQPPTVTVTTWPIPLPTSGKGIIRVCGQDPDAQTLAYSLSIDAGLIEQTDDPSIWIYTPGG